MSFLDNYPNLTSNTSNVNVANVSGTTTLANIDVLKIAGGENTYVAQTDGTGNLTWANPTPTADPSGTANAVQFNNVNDFGGDPLTFSFDRSSNTLNLQSTAVPPTIIVTDIDISGGLNISLDSGLVVQDGLAGQILTTNGANSVEWNFAGSGIGYPTAYNGTSSFPTANTTTGATSVDVTPEVSISANSVVRFGTALNLYKVSNSSTTGNVTTLELERPLVADISDTDELDQVSITTINNVRFAGAINSDYPPPAADTSIGNVKTQGSNIYITQNLHPGAQPPGNDNSVVYNANTVYYSDSGFSINDSAGTANISAFLTPGNTLSTAKTLNLNNAGVKIQNFGGSNNALNISVTSNGTAGGNIAINSNFVANGALLTPSDTRGINLDSRRVLCYNGSSKDILGATVTELSSFFSIDSDSGAGLSYNRNNGRFYNYSGSTMLLLVNFQVTWVASSSTSSPPGTIGDDYGARVTWLSINGDNSNQRYGTWDTNCTGYQYKVGTTIERSYYGPTSQPGTALIKLAPNSYFSIWAYMTQQPGSTSSHYIGLSDPQIGPGAIQDTNAVCGTIYSSRIAITRLDGF